MLLEKIFERATARSPILLDVGIEIRDELRELALTLARGGQVFFHDYSQQESEPYAPFLGLIKNLVPSIQPYVPHRALWRSLTQDSSPPEEQDFLLDEVDYEVMRIRKTILELLRAWDTANQGSWLVLHGLHMAPPSVWKLIPHVMEQEPRVRWVVTWDSRSLSSRPHFLELLQGGVETLRRLGPVYQSYGPSTEVEEIQPRFSRQSFWRARQFLAFADGVWYGEQLLDQPFDTKEEEILFRRAFADCLLCSGMNEEAVIQYQQALRLSREINQQELLVSILRRLAAVYTARGDSQEAGRHALQAYEISQKKLSEKEKALSLYWVLASQDNLTRLIQYLEQEAGAVLENLVNGLKANKLQSHLSALLTNGIVALTYYWQLGFDRALQRTEEGIALAREIGNQYRLAIGYQTLGVLYQNREKPTEALEAFQTSLKYRKQLGADLSYAQGLNGLGYFYFTLGEYQSAYQAYKEALEILCQTDLYAEIAATLYNLGTLFFYARRWEICVQYLEAALTLMDEVGIDNLPYNHRLDFLALLGLAYTKMGKDHLALEKEWQARRIYYQLQTRFRYEHFELMLAIRETIEDPETGRRRFEEIIRETHTKIENFRYLFLLACLEAFYALRDKAYLEKGRQALEGRKDNAYFLGLYEAAQAERPPEPYSLPTPPRLDKERILERARKDATIARLHKRLEEAHFFFSYFDGLLHARSREDVIDVAYKILFQTYPAETLKVWIAQDPEQIPAEWETVYRPWNHPPTPEHLRWLFEGPPPGWIHVSTQEDDLPAHALYGPLRRLDAATERDLRLALNQLILSLRLKLAQEKLEKAATIDPLTGLYNRFELERRLHFEEKRLKRHHGRPNSTMSVLKVDIDNFGPFVDQYGQEAGNRILRWFAMGIKEAIRESDFAGRLENDEFLIILTETEARNAPMVARRLIKKLENRGYVWEALQELKPNPVKLDRPLGCSVGIAQFTLEDNVSLAEVLEKADWALRIAKERGGNQVVIAGQE